MGRKETSPEAECNDGHCEDEREGDDADNDLSFLGWVKNGRKAAWTVKTKEKETRKNTPIS